MTTLKHRAKGAVKVTNNSLPHKPSTRKKNSKKKRRS